MTKATSPARISPNKATYFIAVAGVLVISRSWRSMYASERSTICL